MKFQEQIAEKLLADPRWVGAITEKMVRVWRSRDTIPNQYFNKKYVELMKKGQSDLANQIKDPFFNEDFILKMDLTDEELKEQSKVLKVLESPKVNVLEVCKSAKVAYNFYTDAIRKDEKKRVNMRADHILALKKDLQGLRVKLKKIVDKHQNRARWFDRDKAEIDEALLDDRIVLQTFIEHEKYSSRLRSRTSKKSSVFDDSEANYYIERSLIFLLETQL